MTDYRAFDPTAAAALAATLRRAADDTGRARSSVVAVLDQLAATESPPGEVARVPAVLADLAAWCGEASADLRSRGTAAADPATTPFGTPEEASRAGARDARRVRDALVELGSGELGREEFEALVADLARRAVDPDYAASYAGGLGPQQLTFVAAYGAFYDGDGDGVLNADERSTYQRGAGAVIAPVAAAERADRLTPDQRAGLLDAQPLVLGRMLGVGGFSPVFAAEATARVLGAPPTPIRRVAALQAFAALPEQPAAARALVLDPATLGDAAAFVGDRSGAWPADADAALAALLAAAAAEDPDDPDAVLAARDAVAGFGRRHPELLVRADGEPTAVGRVVAGLPHVATPSHPTPDQEEAGE